MMARLANNGRRINEDECEGKNGHWLHNHNFSVYNKTVVVNMLKRVL